MGVAYQRPLLEKYYASAVSTASVTNVISLVLAVVVTLLFCWNTHNFWVWRQTYYEQPKVSFSRGFVLELGSSTGPSGRYSTASGYNALVPSSALLSPSITALQHDPNGDGYPDAFDISLSAALPDPAALVSHVNVGLFFSVYLDQRIRVSSQSFLTASLPIGSAGGAVVDLVGDLVVDTPKELPMDGATLRGFESPVIDSATLRGPADLALANIVRNYHARNFTTSYALASSPVYGEPVGPGVTINMRINVPVASLEYKPGLWESFKFAIVQLVPVGFIVFLVRSYILDFLYTKHILASRVVKETAPHAHSF